jgi:hypothetical protein
MHTSRKVTGSNSVGINGFLFHPYISTMVLGLTQPLTHMDIRYISEGKARPPPMSCLENVGSWMSDNEYRPPRPATGIALLTYIYIYICVCVCVCVCRSFA